MKYSKGHKDFVRGCYLLMVISIISSCTQKKPGQQNISTTTSTQKQPVTITGRAPVITSLDTCPSPLIIAIPQKKSDSYVLKTRDGAKTIQLLPPEVKSAGFFVPMQNFTTKNGLTHNSVVKGYVDKKGNLWFGTFGGGVSRYDGKSFTNYTNVQGLPNQIVSIFEDKNGNVWFGTGGEGVIRYDGKSFRNYTVAQGLADNLVWAIIDDKNGNLWFGTGAGASRLNKDGKSFIKYTSADGLADNNVSSMLCDKSGNLWFGTWGQGVSCYDGQSFIKYTSADGLANNKVGCIFEDKNGNLWFGNANGKISWSDSKKKHPGEKLSFMNTTIGEGTQKEDVNTITEDKNGNLWVGTGEGAFQLRSDKRSNPGKEIFTSITTQQGLPNNNVNSIIPDKSGNIWFCTDDGGVSRLDRDLKFLTILTTNEGLLRNQIHTILEDKGRNIWFGSVGAGLMRLTPDGKSLSKYTSSQGLPNNSLLRIFQDKNENLWISTYGGGVSRLSPDKKSLIRYTTAQGLPHNPIVKIFEDKNGNFWFGSFSAGVFRLSSDGKYLTRYTAEQGLPDNSITGIFEDKKGNIWFGTKKGLSRFDPDGNSFTNYTMEHGLTNNEVTSILEDKNETIWIGTRGGLSRFDGKSFLSFTIAQGLPDDEIKDVAMDKEGIIWLGTKKGFTGIKGFVQVKDMFSANRKNLPPSNELSNADLESNNFKPVFEIFNIKTGYPIEGIISNILVTHDGIIWAGTGSRERTVRFDYNSMHKNPNPPDVFIQSIKINNEAISWYDLSHGSEKADSFTKTPNVLEEETQFGKILDDDQREAMRKKFSTVKFDSISRFYPLPQNLVLPHRHNNITFDFTAIEPARPGFVHYQYMMEGYENEWSPVSDKTSATYGNIHEGNYTFKLKAQSPDGIWSKPITYTFKVLPPWYRTWWAYVIYALLFLTVLWSLFKWRVKALKKEKLLLEEKVALRTHELQEEKEKVESTLTELKSTQAQLIHSEKMASLGELTAGIAHEIQNPLNFVNNFSEINKELADELEQEIDKGNYLDAKTIAKGIKHNEEKIIHHGKRADGIVKGMLQHSRTSSGQKELTDVNALADEYLRVAYHGLRAKDKILSPEVSGRQAGFNVKLVTDFDTSIGKINIIPQDVGRVLVNLFNNAFYAASLPSPENTGTGAGGFSDSDKNNNPTVWVSTKKMDNKVLIIVKDNGPGIPQKILDKIFQPFFTTKPTGQGTGLGLSLSYDIIKAHGGELKVNTKEGEYAEFIVSFPV